MKAAFALLLLPAVLLAAQAPPGTDIFLMPLSRTGNSLSVGPSVNITARAGYDNQPFFAPDGHSIYYTSQRGSQTDIYRYDLASGAATQVTRTAESEYSPTVMPDRMHFSVIRVEADSTQRLWEFALDGTPVRPVLDSIKPVGYHTWLNADTVFVFVLGEPATLRRAERAHGTAVALASNIGRSLAIVPGGRRVSYVQQDTAGGWVSTLDPVEGKGKPFIKLPEGAAFFAWTPDGDVLTASGNRLLRFHRGDQGWSEIARFTEPGLQQISRLAVSPSGDRLALVGSEPAPKAP